MDNELGYSTYPLKGRSVSRVCGVAFPESNSVEIDLVFLELQNPHEWYRFCLGEGVAYCDLVSNESATDEICEFHNQPTEFMDCQQGLTVTLAHEFEIERGMPAQVSIDFSNGLNLGFRQRRNNTIDSSEVVITSSELAERKIAG